jgi:hypothetical protein
MVAFPFLIAALPSIFNRKSPVEFAENIRNLSASLAAGRGLNRIRTHLISRNGCVARDLVLRQGARSENILYGSLNDEQRRRSAKDPATLRAEFWRAADG